MALLFVDGFTNISTTELDEKWDTLTNSPTISGGSGRFGDGCLSTTNTMYAEKNVTDSTTLIVGFALNVGTMPAIGSSSDFVTFRDTATPAVEIGVTGLGQIRILSSGSAAGFNKASRGGLIKAGVWNYIEAKVKFHDSVGTVEVKVNNESVLSLTGLDTSNQGDNTANRVRLGQPSGSLGTALFSDFYICNTTGSTNTDFLGDIRVETQYPTGAGNYTDWTPSAGNNYAAVDDATPNDDTDYVSTTVAANKDTYVWGNLATTTGTIKGVQINMYARKDEGGTRSIASLSRSNSVNGTGSTQPITNTYDFYHEISVVNPDTAAAWTVTNFNSAEFGFTLIA